MNLDEIFTLAEATARHLSIRIQYPQLVLDKMKLCNSVTSILWNEDWMLWIDRHYIAFSKQNSTDVIYVMTDMEHVSEEMRNVKGMITTEKSSDQLPTLTSILGQLTLARSVMKQSGEQWYLSPIAKTIMPYKVKLTPVTSKRFVLTLCGKCRSYFENTGEYRVCRADHSQYNKEQCSYCSQRYGYDYDITPKRREERI